MRRLIIPVLLLAVFAVACGGDDDGGAGELLTELSIDMVEFEFNPVEAAVPAGEEITLDLSNSGSVEHNWVVLNEDVRVEAEADFDESMVYFQAELQPGEADTFTFTAPGPGGYQVICTIPGHLTAGMEGRLRVVDA